MIALEAAPLNSSFRLSMPYNMLLNLRGLIWSR